MFKLKIPPPVYTLSIAALMWLLHQWMPIAQWLHEPWNMIGLFILAVGVSFDLWAIALFFKAKTTINPMKPDNSQELVDGGLYQYTRNPMYLGLLTNLLGFALWLGSVTPLLGLPLFVVLLTTQQIIPEEIILTKKFGQKYLDYKNRVRRWL
jgi:protein-S-isoprenylcysteine O-methyltransferase Ste14